MKATRQVSVRVPEEHAAKLEEIAREMSTAYAKATVADALRVTIARGLDRALHEVRNAKRGIA